MRRQVNCILFFAFYQLSVTIDVSIVYFSLHTLILIDYSTAGKRYKRIDSSSTCSMISAMTRPLYPTEMIYYYRKIN